MALLSRITQLVVLQALNHGPPLVAVAFASRALGSEVFGEYARLFSFSAIVSLIVNYGFATTGIKSISQALDHRERLCDIFSSYVSASVCSAGFIAVVLFGARLFLPVGSMWAQPQAALAMVYGAAVAITPVWLFIGLRRVDLLFLPFGVLRVAAAAAVVSLVNDPSDLFAYLGLMAFFELALMSWVFLRVGQTQVVWSCPSKQKIVRALRDSSPIFAAAVAINMYTASGPLIAGLVLGNAAVGYYGLADRVRQLVLGTLGPVSNAVFPISCRAAVTRARDDRVQLRRGIAILLSLGIIAGVFVWFFAGTIVSLMGGAAFGPAVEVLRSVALLTFLVTVSSILGTHVLVAHGHGTDLTKVASITAVVGVSALYLLAGRFGIHGVGPALVLTELLSTILLLAVSWRRGLLIGLVRLK